MKYTALTIGPIVKSLGHAHKTREIWAASYFFSFFMENVLQKLKDKGLNNKIIIPYPDARDFDQSGNFKSAGVFPDRLILEGGHFNELQDAVNETIEIFKNYFPATCKDKLDDYFQKYFRFNIIESELEKNANVIFQMSELLANSELQSGLLPVDPMCFEEFLWNITNTGLYITVFGANRSFPSLIEISLKKMLPEDEIELQQKLDYFIKQGLPKEDSDSDIISQINNEIKKEIEEEKKSRGNKKKGFKDYFKNPHKYIAIVQSDGDNVGKLIKAIYEKDSSLIKEFSKSLSEFALEAVKTIEDYGGKAVYAGGDDLLFFAPVITAEKNILELLGEIDTVFERKLIKNPVLLKIVEGLKDDNGDKIKPTVSYGLSVTYYKFPMHEALKSALKLLFRKAKTGKKNNIAYRFQKHSGQSFEDVLYKEKDNSFYMEFKRIATEQNENIVSSLLYNLEQQQVIFDKIISDKNRMQAFFDNTYNEDIHKQYRPFINQVKDLLIIAYKKENDVKKALKKVYNALRFVKFLNEKSHE